MSDCILVETCGQYPHDVNRVLSSSIWAVENPTLSSDAIRSP